jgi:hypothetical protein
MSKTVIAIILVVGIGLWIAFRNLGRTSRAPGKSLSSQKNSADMGRELRRMMLTTSPQEAGAKPTKEFPHVYGVLMDWPIGEQIATVFSSSTGAASLYTTSTFGIIGGEGHETVRTAAQAFVGASDRYIADAGPTTEFPYPGADRVLFGLGQAVLTELRRVTESRQ